MPEAYVYAPFSGLSKGIDCYCKNCPSGAGSCNNGGYCTTCGNNEVEPCKHKFAIFGNPVDIGGCSANTPIKLYVSSTVKSVRLVYFTGYICADNPPKRVWMNKGVSVELYPVLDAMSLPIGKVYYGHVNGMNPGGSGIYNHPNGLYLGNVGDTLSDSGGCYRLFHVHMECLYGNKYYRGCDSQVTTGTKIYKFYWAAIPT